MKKNIATGFDRILAIKVKLGEGSFIVLGIGPKVCLRFSFHLTEKPK